MTALETGLYRVWSDALFVAGFTYYSDAVNWCTQKAKAYPGKLYTIVNSRGAELYRIGPPAEF